MLKRNLIAIAIMTLGLGITSNAYGQFSDTTQGVKSPRDVASGQATGKSKARARTRITHDAEFESAVKPSSSSRRANRRSIQMDIELIAPVKSNRKPRRNNLGDTATHEVGH